MAKAKQQQEEQETSLARTDAQLPAFMQEDVGAGVEELSEFISPPRVVIVQALSKALTEEFTPGETVLLPQRMVVAGMNLNDSGKPSKAKAGAGEKWHFVPLFFWPEWIRWNPRELTDEPAILERSTNRHSSLVEKCRNPKQWREQHPNSTDDKPLFIRNSEHLNFIVMPLDTAIAGMPVVLSFSRSEHRTGSAFASLIKMRKAPIYGCVFEASVGYRTNSQGEWYGIDPRNPAEDVGGFVQDPERYAEYRALHEELKGFHDAGQIRVDLEDDGGGEEPVGTTDEF